MLKSNRELIRWISERLTFVAAVWLAVGLAVSTFVIWAFFELADEVLEGDSRAFDRAVLLWIHDTFPGWWNEPMRLVTALGYYYVVVPLLVVWSSCSTEGAGGSRPCSSWSRPGGASC